jgi:hypothetical protein
MDLRINGIGFQGKKEILYGLTKSAQNAREYETNQAAYLASRIQMRKSEEQAYKKGMMNAYFDMATHDLDYIKVVKNPPAKDLKLIKKILAPFQTEHGTVEPMKIFTSTINDVVNASHTSKSVIRTLTAELLSKLKS